ncbi:MAG: ABC transporter ATP-binding protein, partial [Ferrovibrionaceae bacterium]
IPEPEARMDGYPHEFSGGMRQRVSIAIALLHQPDLIIADEPTTALDVTIQAQILSEVQQLSERYGTALIWITHDLSIVCGLADEIAVMYGGRIVEYGPVKDVIRRPRHRYTDGLLKSVPAKNSRGAHLFQIPGSAPSIFAMPEGCAFRPRCPAADDICRAIPSLRKDGCQTHSCFHPVAGDMVE